MTSSDSYGEGPYDEGGESSIIYIKALESGESDAAEKLWAENFERLARHAERKLGRFRRTKDGEDIAAHALQSFVARVQDGDWELHSRTDLWRLLLTIATNKARRHVSSQKAQRRGGGEVRGDSVFMTVEGFHAAFDNLEGTDPTEDTTDDILGHCNELLGQLSPLEQDIARMQLEGYKREEIASTLGYSIGHIDRCIKNMREKLQVVADD